MSEERKDLIVSIQFFVINTLNALLAGGFMQLLMIRVLDGQAILLDSPKHVLAFLAIFIVFVGIGYILWLFFTVLTLLILIGIGNKK